jgi:diacylglycerol kinase family enzyme
VNVLADNDKLNSSEISVGICERGPLEPSPAGIAIRRVALIYSPASGQHSRFRKVVIDDALFVLRLADVTTKALEMYALGSAGTQALKAVGRGCDTILACGGDGTVHEILQCLVGTP